MITAAALDAARRFSGGQTVLGLAPLGNGLINQTFSVATAGGGFVLQAINSRVFPQPAALTDNWRQLLTHLAAKPAQQVELQIPQLLATADGELLHRDAAGRYWRAQQLIAPAESRERLSHFGEAAAVGAALGHFHRLCSDLPAATLHDTLPGFHIAPGYYRQYLTIADTAVPGADAETTAACRQYIAGFGDRIGLLEQPRQRGVLRERVIHGDPKLNNFLFHPGSDRIVSLIDLDTVKPGLVHYDIGDCLRSCCQRPADDGFDLDCARTILTAYLGEAGAFFTAADHDHLYAAILLIPFELGLRFFSDHLRGNVYFRVDAADENLLRAAAQFRLCASIEAQRAELADMLAALRRTG